MKLMAKLMNRIHSATSELSQRSWYYNSLIYTNLKNFEDTIDFLARFVDCIRCHSNALEIAPHLDSVVTKVKAIVKKIGKKFLKKTNGGGGRDSDGDSFVSAATNFKVLGSSEEKWMVLLDKWVNAMHKLKTDVTDALDNLSINSVCCKISVDGNFQKWKKFVISNYKHVEDVQGYFSAHYRRRSEVRFVAGISYLETLLGYLEDDHIKDSKIEALLNKLGNSIISAQLLCCRWWSSNSGTPSKEDIGAALQDIDRMIGLNNPEFVDAILRVLKTSERFSTIVEFVLRPYIPSVIKFSKFNNESIMFDILTNLLISLTKRVIQMPEEHNLYLSDTKWMLMETASQRHSLYEEQDRTVAQNLETCNWCDQRTIG